MRCSSIITNSWSLQQQRSLPLYTPFCKDAEGNPADRPGGEASCQATREEEGQDGTRLGEIETGADQLHTEGRDLTTQDLSTQSKGGL